MSRFRLRRRPRAGDRLFSKPYKYRSWLNQVGGLDAAVCLLLSGKDIGPCNLHTVRVAGGAPFARSLLRRLQDASARVAPAFFVQLQRVLQLVLERSSRLTLSLSGKAVEEPFFTAFRAVVICASCDLCARIAQICDTVLRDVDVEREQTIQQRSDDTRARKLGLLKAAAARFGSGDTDPPTERCPISRRIFAFDDFTELGDVLEDSDEESVDWARKKRAYLDAARDAPRTMDLKGAGCWRPQMHGIEGRVIVVWYDETGDDRDLAGYEATVQRTDRDDEGASALLVRFANGEYYHVTGEDEWNWGTLQAQPRRGSGGAPGH